MTSPTAAVALAEDMAVLSTGDVRLGVYEEATEATLPVPRRLDQPYQDPAGRAALREAVAAYTRLGTVAIVDRDEVVVAPGARVAILAVLHAVLGRRREVLLPTPYWPSYPAIIEMAGGMTVPVSGPVGDGTLDLEALETRRTPETAVVVVNSPRNPDGAVTPAASLRQVTDWAERHGLVLLFDQVYRGLSLGAEPAPSVLDLYPQVPGSCVIVDGLSKSHALAGLRLGWALARAGLSEQVAGVASHLIGSTCTLAQDVALRVLTRSTASADVGRRLRAELAENLDFALEELDGIPGVACARPPGGIFLFPDVSAWLADQAPPGARSDVTGWLRRRHRVAVVDGTAFGAPGHVRISLGLPRRQLAEGLRRLRAALERSGDGDG